MAKTTIYMRPVDETEAAWAQLHEASDRLEDVGTFDREEEVLFTGNGVSREQDLGDAANANERFAGSLAEWSGTWPLVAFSLHLPNGEVWEIGSPATPMG